MNQETNIIAQSFAIIQLINRLAETKFNESECYKNLELDPISKFIIDKVKIDNQGTLLLFMYALLLIPKELTKQQKYKDKFIALDRKIKDIAYDKSITYPDDLNEYKFTKHMRNALAHGRVIFEEYNYIMFSDEYIQKSFKCEFKIKLRGDIQIVMLELSNIIYQYLRDNSTETEAV